MPRSTESGANKTAMETVELMTRVSSDLEAIPSMLAALNEKGTARFKAAKHLQIISRANPALLYPYIQAFANLLDSSSSIVLWNAIIILAHLVQVDTEKRFDHIFERYFARLWDGKLVTAANILENSGRIARNRPDMAEMITHELLNVDRIPLPTPECREVARGKALTAFAEYIDILKRNRAAKDFVTRCTNSHRASVKKRAEALLQKMD